MRHGSLFSGIGGFDLAAQWMGWENVFQVEIDPFCQKVLEKNFPQVSRYGDIKEFDGTKYRGAIDVLSGGFPCQPYSSAGKRKGKKDARHLWPEYDRVIGEIQPSIVVGENVRGLLNWNGGVVFDEVLFDLENKGYEVAPFLLPACGINAPHRRDRVWIVAHFIGDGRKNVRREGTTIQRGNCSLREVNSGNQKETTTNIEGAGFSKRGLQRRDEKELSKSSHNNHFDYWNSFPNQSPICGRNDGVPHRVDRIRSLGNAIVPQVAYEIFKAIEQTHLAI